jgi:ribosomal protein L16/L10AE
MGKGVGPVKHYVSNVKTGKVILELQTLVSKELFASFKKLILKLPLKVCVLLRSYY